MPEFPPWIQPGNEAAYTAQGIQIGMQQAAQQAAESYREQEMMRTEADIDHLGFAGFRIVDGELTSRALHRSEPGRHEIRTRLAEIGIVRAANARRVP